MCVAVKDGTRIKKAWVLEIGTAWWQRRHESDPKAVAVAFEQLPYEHRPDVVKLPQILSTWDEYRAETTRQRDEAEKAYEKDQRRRADYQARFEKLNLGEHAELEAKSGWVRIRLDVLEARLRDEAKIELRDSADGKDRQ
jgi:pantothenate synthetase